jgi:hypothetical protein
MKKADFLNKNVRQHYFQINYLINSVTSTGPTSQRHTSAEQQQQHVIDLDRLGNNPWEQPEDTIPI